MNTIVNVADIVEGNGKTWRENNLAKHHQIPIDTLVECEVNIYCREVRDEYALPPTKMRLFVVDHQRDCDGSPLYLLATCSLKKLLLSQAFEAAKFLIARKDGKWRTMWYDDLGNVSVPPKPYQTVEHVFGPYCEEALRVLTKEELKP